MVYRYKQLFRDGSTHVSLEPLDFMARLAALVPRPRLNLTHFHGVFAPNFRHRARIVPRRAQGKADSDKPLAPMSWAQRLCEYLLSRSRPAPIVVGFLAKAVWGMSSHPL